MVVPLKTDLRFPKSGQQGHGPRIIHMHNIRTYQGNALDLSLFRDESFDITLVLGPMYHLMLMQLSTLIRVEVS